VVRIMRETFTDVSGPRGDQVAESAQRAAAAGIVGILFLAAADVTMVSALLPAIAAALGGRELFPWLMSIFMATMALSGMAAGALADRHGARRMLTWSVVVFLLASAGAGFAPDMPILLVARAVQGLGAGMIIVLSYASLALLYGMARHTRVQALISITWGTAAVLGPLLGVWIAGVLSWRWIFAINIPIGAACLLAFRHSVPPGITMERPCRFDWPAHLAFSSLVFALMLGASAHSLALDGRALGILAALAMICTWLLWHRVRRDPTVSPLPLAFLRSYGLALLVIIVPCASMGLYASLTFLPMAMAHSAANAGRLPWVIIAAAASFVAASSLAGALVRRIGYDRVVALGALCLAGGALVLSRGADVAIGELVLAQWLVGWGMGFVAVAAVLFAQYAAPAGYLSTYTSAIQVLRNIGAALGINFFAAVQAMAASRAPTVPASHLAFLLLAMLLFACAVLGCLLPKEPWRMAAATH
jgi:MFS family permease